MMLFTVPGTGSVAVGDTTGGGDGTGITQTWSSSYHPEPPIPFRGRIGLHLPRSSVQNARFLFLPSAPTPLYSMSSVSRTRAKSAIVSLVRWSRGRLISITRQCLWWRLWWWVALKRILTPTYNFVGSTDTLKMGVQILGQLNPTTSASANPMINRANLVMNMGVSPTTATGPFEKGYSTHTPADASNKAYLEEPVRALADVTNTRTWNLLIDVIAQSGQMVSTATPSLDNFVVQGERRYWLHVAIDRYTGKIVAQQLEPVYE